MLTARRPNPTFECRRYCLEAGSNEVSRLSQCPEDGAKGRTEATPNIPIESRVLRYPSLI
jgi:hypothetical protein